jgi:cell division protein FtsZ
MQEVTREPEPAYEPVARVEPVREPVVMKIGERVLSEEEIEEKRRFEEQKRAFEDRAARLRSLSINIRDNDSSDEIESVPAYKRKNLAVENPQASSDSFYSGYTIGMNGQKPNEQASIQTINTFLDGRKPD